MSSDVSGSAMLLDGEVIVGNGSVESFNVLLRRARLHGRSTSNALPATFVAFDLLWHEALDRTQRPLEKRRSQLRAIVTESERFAVSRVYADRDSGNECRDRRVALERDTGNCAASDQLVISNGNPVTRLTLLWDAPVETPALRLGLRHQSQRLSTRPRFARNHRHPADVR